ncbi:MAG: ABC transporter ATP-binding protein, partial [Candidatus Hadarchaeum sp.]
LSAIPVPDPTVKKKKIILSGEVPSPANPPTGCTFHPRCPYADEKCRRELPRLTEVKKEHLVACWYPLK